MANDTYYLQKFKCKCGTSTFYTWLSQIDSHKCLLCHKVYKPVFEKVNEAPAMIIGSKHAKGRTPQEKEKRRTEHFKKEIMPTLAKEDRTHFENKFKIPKKKRQS